MKFDRIIFCHKEQIDKLYGGLRIFDNSNKYVLSQLTDDLVDVPLEQTQSKWLKAFRTIMGISRNYTKTDYNRIVGLLDSNKNILLFVSHSQYGTLIKKIKKKCPSVKIATYFHNIEVTMAYNRLKYYKTPLPLFETIRDYRSEKIVAKYSDVIYLLNEREKSLFTKYYSNRDVQICSVALPDRWPTFISKNTRDRLKLLFVGTYFWGNIPGVIDFVENVMPLLNADFYIVGKDMERIRLDVKKELQNIHYVGRVSDEELDNYYKRCDVFIAPITAGGGMKTKVAEALMYGMPVVGTKEAFCGYEIDIEKVGFCSDNINEYKAFLNKIDENRELIHEMSIMARNYYMDKYSVKNALEVYRKTLLM